MLRTGFLTAIAYFVQFKDASGNPLSSPSGKTWFSIPAADFSFSKTVSITGGQLQEGHPAAGALSLSLGANSVDGALLTDLTAGTPLSNIEIAGYSTANGQTYLSDDYQFSSNSGSGLNVTSMTSAADSADAFTFSYAQYQEEYRASPSKGFTPSGYNFALGAEIQTYNSVYPGSEPTTNNGSATPALTYYVKVIANHGQTLVNDAGSKWIEVTDPSFSTASSGKAAAGPLSFSLPAGLAAQALYDIQGRGFTTVELASYNSLGQLADDVTFSNVIAAKATADASKGGSQTFSFDYGAYQDTQTAATSNGSSTTTTTRWNYQTDTAGTSVTQSAPDTICFLAGTGIATPDGDRPIETLRRGDLVLTHDGRTAPVLWLGIQTISRRFANPLRTLPIRIRAGALADATPRRDLFVSPDHALLVDGVLIQAGALVNGTTITRETRTPEMFKYYHVETQDHALILAEGAPAETFVDNVDRMNFDNWAEHEALYPHGRPIDEIPLPRAKAGRQVPFRVRERLEARAAAGRRRVA